jgi:hypothetical protein
MASPQERARWFGRRPSGGASMLLLDAAPGPGPQAPPAPAPLPAGAWGALIPEGAAACALLREQYVLGPHRTVHVGRTVNPQRALCLPLQQGACARVPHVEGSCFCGRRVDIASPRFSFRRPQSAAAT